MSDQTKDSQAIHLVIATPCYGGQVTGAYFTSLIQLQGACLAKGIRLTFLMPGGDALITRARQDLAATFLGDPSATHLLFIDADIGFEPDQVLRLLHFNQDITAGLYPLKRVDWGRVQRLAKANYPNLESGSLSYVHELVKDAAPRDGFAKASYVGTGFLMVKRAALLAMAQRYPELQYKETEQDPDPLKGSPWRFALFNCIVDPATGAYLSEDYSFCRRWTDMGGEIWVDLQSKLDHVGPTTFKGDASIPASLPAAWIRPQAPPPEGKKP